MGGPRVVALVALAALLATACGERQTDAPTAPEISFHNSPPPAPTGSCSLNTVVSLVKNEFGNNSTQAGLASDMKSAGAQTDNGTFDGYKILLSIAAKYETTQPSTANASATAVALLQCMKIGGATVPTAADFANALASTGAFEVRGLTNPDLDIVTSHDDAWLLEPPGGGSWQSILGTGLGASTDARIKYAFLAFGNPISSTGFTNDVPVSGVFNWATIPVATFGGDGVVVGECAHPSNYLQHLAAGTTGVEVLGFVAPSCAGSLASAREAPPRTLAERLFRILSPAPLSATLLTTTGSGGSKRTLSPFEVIFPSNVAATAQFQWNKKANQVNVPLKPTPTYSIGTAGGTPFLQPKVLFWLTATNNSGTNVLMCNNWAYTRPDGVVAFTNAFLNKAGGYTVFTHSIGAADNSAAGVQLPSVPASAPLVSPLFNVKNNGGNPPCPNFTPSFDANGVLLNPPEYPGPNP
jgi:hypothetical protein